MPDQINQVLLDEDSITQVLRNHVKEKLRRGEVVSSMTVRLVRGIEIARIAKTAGFDSLYIDVELAASRSTPPARSAWRRWRWASRRSCACRPTRRNTSRGCSMAARSVSSPR